VPPLVVEPLVQYLPTTILVRQAFLLLLQDRLEQPRKLQLQRPQPHF
jgi:hypothetical protein